MIKELQIKGFQSHTDTTLELDPGVNYIIGKSNSGKSAMIRAFRWVWLNRPLGSAHVSCFSSGCSVAIEGNDWKIVRTQQDKTNLYNINGESYQSFGQNPPQEVSDILNIGDVNLQTQRDSLFLLGETPGKVAAHLNSLVGLDIVDRILKEINSQVRSISTREKVYRERLEELQKQLAEIPKTLQEAEKTITHAYEVQDFVTQAEQYLDWLYEQVDSLIDCAEMISFTEGLISQIDYNRMEALEKNTEILYNKIRYLEDRKEELININQLLQRIVPKADYIQLYEELSKKEFHLSQLLQAKEVQFRITMDLQKMERRLKILTKEFSDKMPKECPLCGQLIPRK